MHKDAEKMDEHQNTRFEIAGDINLMPGAYVEPGAVIEENVYIGPNAVILSNGAGTECSTIIRRGVEIGANATVLPGVTVGIRARIAPGSVVKRSVPPLAIVEGNPASITGYVETWTGPPAAAFRPEQSRIGVQASRVRGVAVHTLRAVPDLRGSLSVGEFEQEIPFKPSRFFLVFDVPTAETRGEHAHRRCKIFLLAVKGSVNVVADDGRTREEFVLNRPDIGLYLPSMIWGIQYCYSKDAILLVFASEHYDPEDYIRDYTDFLRLAEQGQNGS
jgi:carbonic anhydrase/acetyltransferase-like protein (isoleucine patch superfamily)